MIPKCLAMNYYDKQQKNMQRLGKLLERNNYKIKIFNTINFKKSMCYNPFAYLHSEKDILKLVTTLMRS